MFETGHDQEQFPSMPDPQALTSAALPGVDAVERNEDAKNGEPLGSATESAPLRVASLADEIFGRLTHARGSAIDQSPEDSPTRGSMRSLGDLPIELKYGEFKAYAFESMQGKHLIALVRGDVSGPEPLLMRIHSECITSETLCGCDCDCVEQLDAALKRISEEGRGVLFYLRQEGRGAGYASKARDRMGVSASDNQVETFEAYRQLGLPADLRRYESVADVAYLLDITAPFKVMTNNPDKVNGLKGNGFEIAAHCELFVPPNPFNAFYLVTKSKHGHMMDPGDVKGGDYPWQVEPFSPYRLKDALRFTHNASYPLPIRPTNGTLVLDSKALGDLQEIEAGLARKLIAKSEPLPSGKLRVTLDQEVAGAIIINEPKGKLANFMAKHPNWFNDHIYSDTATGWDYVALTYDTDKSATPLVRVHSESLFQRFPLKSENRSGVYERSIQAIVENGNGMLLLYPEDGKGNGFGTAFMEKRLVHRGLAANIEEASKILGLQGDARNYEGAAQLIKHHYGEGPVRLVFSSPENMAAKSGLIAALTALGVETADPLILNGN